MSAISTPAPAAETGVSPAPQASLPVKTGGRLVSLDAYRGFIMLLLISEGFGFGVLRNYPGWEWLANQCRHVAWEGCTFWDLIQPAFTFMVGVAMPFAVSRRLAQGATQGEVFRHVLWRALILILLSNIFSNWGREGALRLQFINVLSQIAFGYVLCFLITRLRFVQQVGIAIGIMVFYTLLYVAFPGPDGPWSQTGNIGAVIDRSILGYNYSGHYTTINFIGNALTILFGCWAGALLAGPESHTKKLKVLAGAALAAFALGLALEPLIPMVKRLWTLSFTFFSAGWVILMLMAFYWIIEVKQARRWSFAFLVLGMNSIFVYSLSQIGLSGWLDRGLSGFTGRFGFLGELGAIPQQILVLAGLWYVCYWLYQRKIFFKI